MASVFNAFIAYQFLKTLTNKWDQMEAYKLGIIDKNGKQLKKTAELETAKEKQAYTIFHRLVFNLKRVLERFPFGKSRIASYSAAFALLKESRDDFSDDEYELMESMLMDYINLQESTLSDSYFESVELVEGVAVPKKTYQHAVNALKSVVDRKMKEAGKRGLKHSVGYYSAMVAKTYSGVNSRELERMFKSAHPQLAKECVEEEMSEEIVNAVGTGANVAGLTGVPSKFAGMKVFPIQTKTYVGLMKGKKKYARWKKYMETQEATPMREYIKKSPKEKVVLMDQSSGTMMILHRHNEI